MSAPADHPLRQVLTDEMHARPFANLAAPESLTHVAMVTGEGGAQADREHLAALCARYGVPAPATGANHFFADFGPFRLKWERHIEFCTWTFMVHGPFDRPFDRPAIAAVPEDWARALPGARLVAVHVAIEPPDRPSRPVQDVDALFGTDSIVGGRVADGAADVWTDFRKHEDGYGRILVQDRSLARLRRAGRMVQRILEIETYRMMALLALPLARELGPRVSAIDRDLAAITEEMRDLSRHESGVADERRLLDRLMDLAAEVERLTAASDYRFGAARAYYAMIERRLAKLGEQRLEGGVPTLGDFIERRLAPAMRTCFSTASRLEAMAERLARASTLLRTRVNISLEGQNQALLASMDRRARLQLRLQETVEGLSVAAISYYVLGLIGYALRGVEAGGVHLRHDLWTALAIPVVVGAVWAAVRRVRRHLERITLAGPDR